ncbi:unnamed protein product [Effrenium voratum]|nr:unnamed protein product [Effrenium voratum]
MPCSSTGCLSVCGSSQPRRGTLKKFFAEKGIGYIAPDDGSEDVFIHFQSLINGGEPDMIPGAKLSYDLEINDRNGKTKAVRVKIEVPGDPNNQWKGGGGGGGGGGYGKMPGQRYGVMKRTRLL